MLESSCRPWEKAAHILAVSGFAIAQPLYAVLAKHVDFFVAHDAQPLTILSLVFLLSLGVPFMLMVLEWVAGTIRESAGHLVHLALLGILAALAFLPLFKKLQGISDTAVVAAAALAGIGGVCAYALSDAVRSLMTYMAAATLVFPVSFVFFSPVREFVFDQESVTAPDSNAVDDTQPPVFLIIFEETPLTSLLDEQRLIDAVRYPNFSRLSRDAHWFRNYTVNATATKRSMATVLTGRYVKGKVQPLLAKKYPQSLFALLGGTYQVVASGISKRMFPRKYIAKNPRKSAVAPARGQSAVQRLGYLVQDVSVVYSRIVVPKSFSGRLPAVADSWAHFVAPDATEKTVSAGRLSKRNQFERFMESVVRSSEPTFYYLHAKLAHNTWQLLPSGKQYRGVLPGCEVENQAWGAEFGFGGKRWSDNEWLVVQGYQRHLLEVGAADAKLGKLISHLEDLGIYDQSLIVVMSDHGCSFEPGERIRGRIGTVARDTMPVPFFVKLPFQREGVISDDNVEAIDVLPTIADVLGVEVPWPVDGHSMFSTSIPRRNKKTLLFSTGEHRVDARNKAWHHGLRKKLEIFGSGTTKPDGYFTIGPYGHVVGAKTTALGRAGDSHLTLEFDEAGLFDQVDTADPFCSVCYVSGEMVASTPLASPVHLAISVNGVIRAVTQTYREPASGASLFYAIVPDDAFRDGKNEIDVYAMESGGGERIRLSRIAERSESPR